MYFRNIVVKKTRLAILPVLFIGLGGCKKFISIDPPTHQVTSESVFSNDLTANAAVTGLYSNLSLSGLDVYSPNLITISKLLGLSADEFGLWSGASVIEKAYFQNALYSTLNIGGEANAGVEFWNVFYPQIYRCNQYMQEISKSKTMSPLFKRQLLGEVKFISAILYFYLVNLFGDVPLMTGTDPQINRRLPRAPVTEVYASIIANLKEAQELLSSSFLNSSLQTYPGKAERVRPSKWAATALLARVYLFSKDYVKAESEASTVLNEQALFDLPSVPLNEVFVKNSKEAIWQLQPVNLGWNTIYARWFALSNEPVGFSGLKSTYLSLSLKNSFEVGDARKINWVGVFANSSNLDTFYFPYKYRAGANSNINADNPGALSEYHMVIRLAELYLIRAEARAMQNNISGAVADLNVIRTRARDAVTATVPDPLPNLPATMTQSQVIDAVLQERRIELFSEWGHRWLDLKRTGKVDVVMSSEAPKKGGTWQTTDQLFPIPIADLTENLNLAPNPGY